MRDIDTVCIVQNSIRTLAGFRLGYIKLLVRDGYKVHCIAPNDDQKAREALQAEGVLVHEIPSNSRLMQMININSVFLRKYIFSRKKTIVVSHFISTVVMALPILLFNRKNICVIEGIGTFFTGRPLASNIVKTILTRLAAARVFMNEEERSRLGKPSDTVLYGIGVDLIKFAPAELTNNVSEAGNRINLLYVGRLLKDKGIHELLAVVRNLQAKQIQVHLTLVGDIYRGNPGSLTEADIDSINSEFGESLTFHQFTRNVVPFYQNADVLLLLSQHEGFPAVVMEANACGIPAICYDVIGCREAIVSGENGFLVGNGDIDAIVDILKDKNNVGMKESIRVYAERNFDAREKDAKLVGIISDL